MIEKYFLTGVRFKWTPPTDYTNGSKDGSIIANPTKTSPPMIYDGLDGDLVNHGLPNVTTLGFSKNMAIPYSWLAYSVGHTTKKMLAAGDTLTGFMSGCLITVWQDTIGHRYVSHVGTVDGNPMINARVRHAFGAAMTPNTTGFNPAAAWTPGEVAPKQAKFKGNGLSKVMALVTGTGAFYSILMFRLMQSMPGAGGASDAWCVGGIKRVPPMNPQQLRNALMAA